MKGENQYIIITQLAFIQSGAFIDLNLFVKIERQHWLDQPF